jgi:HJR/Mrr/RecB family endonuclease
MEFFKEQGYDVIAEAPTRDAGVDFALKSPSDGSTILVEVKKLSAQSRVSVDTVRRLQSAVSVEGASFGVLVTTSGYTAAAVAMAIDAPILLRTVRDLVHVGSNKTILESPVPSNDH